MGHRISVGGQNFEVEALLVFLGALLCWDRAGSVGHRSGLAWTKCWAAKRQFITQAFSPRARLQRLRAETSPVMQWGSSAGTLGQTSSA